MILPQTDHAMIPIAAALLLTNSIRYLPRHDRAVGHVIEVARWGYKLHRRDEAKHHRGWLRAKSPRDQHNHSKVRNVGLALSYTNSGGRL